jgi:hypothetical protein
MFRVHHKELANATIWNIEDAFGNLGPRP